jgi:hypothetical protein
MHIFIVLNRFLFLISDYNGQQQVIIAVNQVELEVIILKIITSFSKTMKICIKLDNYPIYNVHSPSIVNIWKVA